MNSVETVKETVGKREMTSLTLNCNGTEAYFGYHHDIGLLTVVNKKSGVGRAFGGDDAWEDAGKVNKMPEMQTMLEHAKERILGSSKTAGQCYDAIIGGETLTEIETAMGWAFRDGRIFESKQKS